MGLIAAQLTVDRSCGRSRPGRLHQLDAWIVEHAAPLLARRDGDWQRAWVVDVGVGDPPEPTLELHRALAQRWPDIGVLGVDIVPSYVSALAECAPPGLTARLGGASLPVGEGEAARLVRAVNLLRGAREHRVDEGLRALAAPLLPGGWLVEGSTDTPGDVGVFRILRSDSHGLTPQFFLLTTTFERGFDPRLFTAWLPRGLGRHARPAPSLQARFDRWSRSVAQARESGFRQPRQTFVAAAEDLALHDRALVRTPEWWARGLMWWRDVGGADGIAS